MVTLADIDTLMTAAIAAMDAGDYATAIRKAIAAQGRLALLPDGQRNAGGGGSQSMTWTRQTINDFIANLRRQQGASVGIGVSNVEYDTVEDSGSSAVLGEFE